MGFLLLARNNLPPQKIWIPPDQVWWGVDIGDLTTYKKNGWIQDYKEKSYRISLFFGKSKPL